MDKIQKCYGTSTQVSWTWAKTEKETILREQDKKKIQITLTAAILSHFMFMLLSLVSNKMQICQLEVKKANLPENSFGLEPQSITQIALRAECKESANQVLQHFKRKIYLLLTFIKHYIITFLYNHKFAKTFTNLQLLPAI